MKQYLDPSDQDIRYKSDLDAFQKGRWVKLDVKASYLSITSNFSIELASIEHAARHRIVLVGEIRNRGLSQFCYLFPPRLSHFWHEIRIPQWRWSAAEKQLLETVYPDKHIVWDGSTRRLGSGTPYVLINARLFSKNLGDYFE